MELAGYRSNGSVRMDEYDRACIRHVLLHGEQCAKHDMDLDQGVIPYSRTGADVQNRRTSSFFIQTPTRAARRALYHDTKRDCHPRVNLHRKSGLAK